MIAYFVVFLGHEVSKRCVLGQFFPATKSLQPLACIIAV